MVCEYKHIFGKEKEGPHSYRLFDVAIVDVIMTIVIGHVICYYTNYDIYNVLLILFTTGIVLHRIFCVRTTIDKLLFNDY